MAYSFRFSTVLSWAFGLIISIFGVLNLILIHPVPGIIYLLLSLLFFPPVNDMLRKKFGFSIPIAFLIVLGLVIFWFTLGVSDLAEVFGL